ncbi:MAG: hypothetical protein HUU19_01335 [Phycisphaerales bacterium]|nr:hypothetical protein [Phycisphaerales bacterium]
MADSNDLDLFWDAYSEGEELADLTTDGMVNSDDLDEFVVSYEEMEQP